MHALKSACERPPRDEQLVVFPIVECHRFREVRPQPVRRTRVDPIRSWGVGEREASADTHPGQPQTHSADRDGSGTDWTRHESGGEGTTRQDRDSSDRPAVSRALILHGVRTAHNLHDQSENREQCPSQRGIGRTDCRDDIEGEVQHYAQRDRSADASERHGARDAECEIGGIDPVSADFDGGLNRVECGARDHARTKEQFLKRDLDDGSECRVKRASTEGGRSHWPVFVDGTCFVAPPRVSRGFRWCQCSAHLRLQLDLQARRHVTANHTGGKINVPHLAEILREPLACADEVFFVHLVNNDARCRDSESLSA